MGKFKSLISKFQKARDEIQSLGAEIVEGYPNSKTLIKMTQEIDVAVEALDTLLNSLDRAFTEAENDDSLKKSLLQQMEDSDIYSKLEPEHRELIAEYLVQNKQGLADQEMLLAYVEKALSQKSVSDLVGMYPKAKIIERGQKMDDGSDAFDAYASGLDAYRKDFDFDKTKAVKELAKLWINKGLEAVAKEFYALALKPSDDISEG